MIKKTDEKAAQTETAADAKKPSVTKKVKVLSKEPAATVSADGNEKVKKPVFLDRTLLRTDVKKRDAKPAIEAALAELAAALIAGEELVLPPLGKIKVVRSKDLGQGAKALTLKLRTMKTEPDPEV